MDIFEINELKNMLRLKILMEKLAEIEAKLEEQEPKEPSSIVEGTKIVTKATAEVAIKGAEKVSGWASRVKRAFQNKAAAYDARKDK